MDERHSKQRGPQNGLADLESHQPHDVACVGILVADVFANPVPRLPNPGELTTTSSLVMSVGGSAANTAVALRILGQTVDVAGKVGSDMQGDFVISELRRRGIGTANIRRSTHRSTSGTVVLNVTGEDRRYLHCIGANAEFGLEDLELNAVFAAKVLCFGGFLALPSFTVPHLTKLLREAKSKGVTTVLDVAIPVGASFGIHDIAPVLRYTDYFLPNYEEAALLTSEQDERNQAIRLSELNPECAVIITRGAKGPLARWRGRFIEIPPIKLDSVEESGAGDAFSAGLIAAILQHWTLERALMFAAAIGASSTRTIGCFKGVFSFQEAIAFLESNLLTCARWDTLLGASSRPA